MKVFSMSQRIYYKDLEPYEESIIKKDLELYNCMLHKAFKICFDRAYKDVTYSETDQRMIKSFYGTSDYFPLSAIYEAKALVKSLKCREKEIYRRRLSLWGAGIGSKYQKIEEHHSQS